MKRNILITGASGDIGLEIVLMAAAKSKYNIAAFGNNNMKKLEDLREKILSTDPSVDLKLYKADLGSADEAAAAVRLALSDFGHFDCVVNNAGRSVTCLDQELSADAWAELCASNLSSVMYVTRALIPSMIANGEGRILNISSVWGVYGGSCEAAYSATKGGINAYTKALAKELAPSRISVNALAPGMIDTKMNDHLSPEEKADFEESLPFGRAATPGEVADMVLLLLDAPLYLTGQVIGFDGGF